MNNRENKYAVLIFEDDFSLALEWKEALRENGIHSEHAWEVGNALNLCKQQKFDAIICDVFIKDNFGKLRTEAGLTLISSLRNQLKGGPQWGRSVPILAVTGSPKLFGFNVLDNIRSMGISFTMRKPFTPNRLVETVREIILDHHS